MKTVGFCSVGHIYIFGPLRYNCMYIHIHGIDICINICMYVCMYVCIIISRLLCIFLLLYYSQVLHYHLDQQEVAFVGITNHILDAAKTNRAVSLFRPTASKVRRNSYAQISFYYTYVVDLLNTGRLGDTC